MDDWAKKIDVIRKRTGATYKKAAAILDKADGDLEKAVCCLKDKDLFPTLARIVKRGNASRIIVRDDEKVVLNVPVTAGFIGAVMAPGLAFLGGMALLASSMTLEVERPSGVSGEKDT